MMGALTSPYETRKSLCKVCGELLEEGGYT